MKNLILIILVNLSSIVIGFGQTIELVKDIFPGPESGFLEIACNQNGELHFIGQDEGPKFSEVYSLDSEGIVKKIAMAPDVDGAQIVQCTNQYTYIYNRSASTRELYKYSSNSLEKIYSFNSDISYSYNFKDGVVFIEEDTDKNKTILYFSDDSDQAFTIIENVNIGFSSFEITRSNEYLIVSPRNDNNFSDGVLIYNTLTHQIDTTLLQNKCDFLRYAYGFEDHIVYSCDGEYSVCNILTKQSAPIGLNGAGPLGLLESLDLFLESDDYIFLTPQERLYSISKEDLSIEILSEQADGSLPLFEVNNLVYFLETTSSDVYHLFQTDGSIESKTRIDYGVVRFRIAKGAYFYDTPHFIVNDLNPGNFTNVLVRLYEDDEFEVIKELYYESFNPLLESIGDKLIFGDNENDTGVELYALSYTDTNVSDINQSKIDLYPNPSNGFVYIPKLDSEIQDIIVVSTLGQSIPFEKSNNGLRINGEGLFYIIIKTTTSVYSSLVHVKDGN